MKYEIIKGSEKDFEGAGDGVLVIFSIDNGDGIFRSACPSVDNDFHEGWNLIAERRPISEPVWDGEGLPPVGVECEVKTSARHPYEWEKCKIVFSDENSGVAFVYVIKGSLDCVGASRPDFFRPIPSPEMIHKFYAASKLCEIISSSDIYSEYLRNGEHVIADAIYDAIAAGKIPGVKLEGK